MSYKLVKNLTNVNYEKGNKGRKYIVIHYTGNTTDTAANNANYFKNTNRGASAHYFVDKTQVVQVVDDANTAWAVGVNYGSNNLFGKCTNYNSISIEMCSDGGKIADATYNNTVALTKDLMKKYSIPASNVVRHWDVCSKACPGWTGWGANGKDGSIWNKFKKELTANSTSNNVSGHGGTSGKYWATVQLYALNQTDAQKWIVHKHSDNTYSIKNKACDLYLDVKSAKTTNGTIVQVYSWNNTRAQRWIIDRDMDDSVDRPSTIRSVLDKNMVIDVKSASKSNGAVIQLYKSNNTTAQLWNFVYAGNSNEYYIINAVSGKALDVKGGGK